MGNDTVPALFGRGFQVKVKYAFFSVNYMLLLVPGKVALLLIKITRMP